MSAWLPEPWAPAALVHAYESGVRTVSDLLGLGPASAPLHWERSGSGPPVLLITGLGLSGGAWWRTVPVLSRELGVITFDNRGVGRSRALLHAYTTEAMAEDARAILDAAEVES